MTDLCFVALLLGFFASATGLVKLCERIVGPAPVVVLQPPDRGEPVDTAA